jgi:hypothetical protein
MISHTTNALLTLVASGVIVASCSAPDTSASHGPATIEQEGGVAADDGAAADDGPAADAAPAHDATTPIEAAAEAAAETGATNVGSPDADAPDGTDSVGSPAECGLTACVPGQPCADLSIDQNDLVGSILFGERQFDPASCAVDEGCITQPGLRRLLKFDMGTINIGNADLHLGDPTKNACFTYSLCHQHYHFRGVARYTLYAKDGVTVVAVGHKQGFCLDDVYPIPSLSPPPAQPATPFDCTNQGLHVGYEDVYPNDIDCQWIDITGVPPGDYVLSVIVNPDHYLPESNFDNNEARTQVTIPAQ